MGHGRRTKRAKTPLPNKEVAVAAPRERTKTLQPAAVRMPSDRVLRARKADSTLCRHLLMGFVGRPPKRLFTPEIKRKLKEWLVKRRRNPYPTREEKQALAKETGLEYSQICNWFANWRRKLKNAEAAEEAESDISMDSEEPRAAPPSSWRRRILIYNNVAARNAEKIPIDCDTSLLEDSDEDMELSRLSSYDSYNPTVIDHCYSMTPIISEMDKNGNYCEGKKWIWGSNHFEKPRAFWPPKENTDAEMEDDAEVAQREAEIEAAQVLATLGTA